MDPQGFTTSDELMLCGPSGKAAVRGNVVGKDPDQTIGVLVGYRRNNMMRLMLAV